MLLHCTKSQSVSEGNVETDRCFPVCNLINEAECEHQRVNGFYLAPPPRPPAHFPYLHRRLRRRAPPRSTRICAFLARKEGLGRAGRPRARWVVRRHLGHSARRVGVCADRKSLVRSPFRQSHVASLVHALLILPLAARCLHIPALAADRAFGWDPRVGTLFAVTSG